MIFNWPFMAALGVAVCCALVRAHPALDRTAVAVGANWVAGSSYVLVTGVDDPAIWFALIDFTTALVILRRPAARVQGFIGATYLLQIVVHTGYYMASYGHVGAGYESGKGLYLDVLTWIGWMQIAALFLWAGAHGHKARYFRRLHPPRGDTVAPHHPGDVR